MIIRTVVTLFTLSLFTSAVATAADTSALLREKANAYFTGHQPGGVVLVRKGDTVLLREGYGFADIENGVKMTPDAALRLASCTKQFTAVAILLLAENGHLKLDQAIGHWLPELSADAQAVTVRQLLNHTSGIKNISRIKESRAARRSDANLDTLIAFFKDLPLEFTPGSRFNYSNSNYILLTKLIEKVSGKTYADFMQKTVFAPAGMNQTRVDDHMAVIPKRARGYVQDDNGLRNADFISMTQPAGAGALISTVDDLNRWDLALQSDTLISKEWLRLAHAKTRTSDGTEIPYGFGLMVSDLQGLTSHEHSGFINGFQSYTLSVPESKVYVTVLTNSEALDPSEISADLAALAAGRPFDKTPAKTTPAAQWLGRYDLGNNEILAIYQRDGQLFSKRQDETERGLIAAKEGRYYFREGVKYLSFENTSEGHVRVVLHDRWMGDSSGVRIKD